MRHHHDSKPCVNCFKKSLKIGGFVRLGRGEYSEVFLAQHGQVDRVLKIGRLNSDDGWLKYVKYLQTRRVKNQHAPVIYSLKKIEHDSPLEYDDFYVAEIELLAKKPASTSLRKYNQFRNRDWKGYAYDKRGDTRLETIGIQTDRLFEEELSPSAFMRIMQDVDPESRYVSFNKFCIRMANTFSFSNNISPDIHEDNIMWRGDVPVLTDPFA